MAQMTKTKFLILKGLLLALLPWSLCKISNTSVNHRQQNLTYTMFIYKGLNVCTGSDLLRSDKYASDPIKALEKVYTCVYQLWHQCLVKNPHGSDVQGETWFPCSKAVTVATFKQYRYIIKADPSFHFNVTFLRFHLQRTLYKCKIHFVQVMYITSNIQPKAVMILICFWNNNIVFRYIFFWHVHL